MVLQRKDNPNHSQDPTTDPRPTVHTTDPPAPLKLLSYADDLEVFLSGPHEWSTLLSLLDLYNSASNGRVNLAKTVLVSLTGVDHSEWHDVISSHNIDWHTASSSSAVRYLGYPLHSSPHQLTAFLEDIKIKLLRHVNYLKGRHLSIRGSGIVANSLLLSKIYHLLRVVPVPQSWLVNIRAIVRGFILPFFPAPSWTTLTCPRKHGGVGLVDIIDQSFALHMIYVQRLLYPISSSDFLSPWIIHFIHQYTRQNSILPIFMFPKVYRRLLSSCPNLGHLSELLIKLPPLCHSSSWVGNWFSSLPLCSIITPVIDSVDSPRLPPIPKTPLRYLLSDLLQWLPSVGKFSVRHNSNGVILRRIVAQLFPFDRSTASLTLPPAVQSHIDFSLSDLVPLSSSPVRFLSVLPPSSHWQVRVGERSGCPVKALSLNQLRRYWHRDKDLLVHRLRPPLIRRVALMLPPSSWRSFWRLNMSPKAFTPWWRVLHGSVAYLAKLHRWNPSKHPSPICRICNQSDEDLYHFVIGCIKKSLYWSDVCITLSRPNELSAELFVWTALVSLTSCDGLPLPDHILSILGNALGSMWKYHWHCVMNDKPWSRQGAISMFVTEHSIAIGQFKIRNSNASTSLLNESPL